MNNLKLTDNQLRATNHFKGPALVLAVPGAGKTTVILYRIINLIKNGVDPRKVLTITFSKAASLDMSRRFEKLSKAKGVHFLTIHALCFRILLDFGRIKGKKFDLLEKNRGDKIRLLKDVYISINKAYPTDELLENTISEISFCKNTLLNPESFEAREECQTLNFSKIYKAYEDYKGKKHLIDFDDMLTISYKILRDDSYIRQKYRSFFEFILLDEGQDTSYVQFLILKILAKPLNNLFIVADDDQSIYAFRGASPRELFDLEKTYGDLKTYYMEENFRSSKNIVNISNSFIGQNENRFKKTVFTENGWASPATIVKVKSPADEYDFIFKQLQKLEGESAILYRNNLSAIGLVEFLERKNISFNIKDQKNKFFSHFIVRDIIDILKFAEDLSNIDLYQRFYYKLEGYISKRHIAYMKSRGGSNIFDCLFKFPDLPDYYLEKIGKLNRDFKKLKRLNLSEAIEFIEDEMGYLNYLKENSKRLGESYKALMEYLFYIKFIGKNAPSLDDFLGRLKHLEYLLQKPKSVGANLELSTIHSSKGLEYDNVFLIDLVDGNLPTKSAIDNIRENLYAFEEERRLFYVGMTRAKKNLFFLYPKYMNGEEVEISRFLSNLESM